MTDFWMPIIVCVLALLIIVLMTWLGVRLFFLWPFLRPLREDFHMLLHEFMGKGPNERLARILADHLSDHRERRNEFWTTYGQITLAIFITAVPAVLLLTKTIDPDAGLPILSAIAGFAVAKGVGLSRRGPGGGELG